MCQWHHGRSAYLTRRFDYFSRKVLTFVLDYMAEGVLNCRIVILHGRSANLTRRVDNFRRKVSSAVIQSFRMSP